MLLYQSPLGKGDGERSCRNPRQALAVVDAKYKAEKPAGYPNADLCQLLAYCTVLGLDRGHLVYAKDSENPAHHVVRRSGIEIICHAVDLDNEPEVLLDQMRNLASHIAASSARPPSGWTSLANV